MFLLHFRKPSWKSVCMRNAILSTTGVAAFAATPVFSLDLQDGQMKNLCWVDKSLAIAGNCRVEGKHIYTSFFHFSDLQSVCLPCDTVAPIPSLSTLTLSTALSLPFFLYLSQFSLKLCHQCPFKIRQQRGRREQSADSSAFVSRWRAPP